MRTSRLRASLVYIALSFVPIFGTSCMATELRGARNALVVVSGNNQRTLPGAQVPRPIVVRALDGNGNPLAGVIIRWNGSAGSEFEHDEALSAVTDQNGVASKLWIVGYVDGMSSHSATASADGLTPATFIAQSADGALELTAIPDTLRLSGVDATGAIRLRVRSSSASLDTVIKPKRWGAPPNWVAFIDVPLTAISDGLVLKATQPGTQVQWVSFGSVNVFFTVIVD